MLSLEKVKSELEKYNYTYDNFKLNYFLFEKPHTNCMG